MFSPPKKLRKLGTSDHYTVLILPRVRSSHSTPSVSSLLKRDLRPSRVEAFGRWITQYDWGNVFNLNSVKEKFDLFSITKSEAKLGPVLTDIYNSSLKQGYAPAQLKESLVRPLPKFRLPSL